MSKIATGVLILRLGKSKAWNDSKVDDSFVAWLKTYIDWVYSAPMSIAEKNATKLVQFLSLRYS